MHYLCPKYAIVCYNLYIETRGAVVKLQEKDRITYKTNRTTNGKVEIKKAQVQRVFGNAVEAWCSETGNMLLIFIDSNEIKKQ